jgi:hypothetical protein
MFAMIQVFDLHTGQRGAIFAARRSLDLGESGLALSATIANLGIHQL